MPSGTVTARPSTVISTSRFGPASRLIARPPLRSPSFVTAEAMALAAVWPRPQIEASRIDLADLRQEALLVVRRNPAAAGAARRWSASSCRTVPTRQGTHWPHDSSRKNAAMRRTRPQRSTESSSATTTPDPRLAPMARVPSKVRGTLELLGRHEAPRRAAEQHRLELPPSRHAAGQAQERLQRRAEGHLVEPGPGHVSRDAEELRAASSPSVPTAANAGPARRTMSRTFTRVSTLLTTVGLPNRPATVGNGGLLRGSPR